MQTIKVQSEFGKNVVQRYYPTGVGIRCELMFFWFNDRVRFTTTSLALSPCSRKIYFFHSFFS